MKLPLLVALCFAAGFAGMQGAIHRDALLALTFESFKARHRAMTSVGSGPDRYYVVHDRGLSLADAVRHDPAIVGMEVTALDGLTGVDIAPGNAPSIDAIRALDGVHYAVRSRLPLFCH